MSFSLKPDEAKTELDSALLLLEKINIILSADLKKVVKTAYGLTAEELKASETARADIKAAEAAYKKNKSILAEIEVKKDESLAELSKREATILSAQTELDSNREALAAESRQLAEFSASLVNKQAAVDEAMLFIQSQKKDLSSAQKRLDAGLDKLKADADALAAQKAALDAHEAALRNKSAQLQSLVAGM
jgi:chromosome segregation ATPase